MALLNPGTDPQHQGQHGCASEGVAHFAGPLPLEVDGDHATAVNCSLIMRRDDRQFYLWRVSAVRWDPQQSESTGRVRRQTNGLLGGTGVGRELFSSALRDLFSDGTL